MNRTNVNTWLLTGLLAICGWTLFTVHQTSGAVLVAAEKASQHDREITELRTRVISAEAAIVEIKLQVARLRPE